MIVGLLKYKIQVSVFTLFVISFYLFACNFFVPLTALESYNTQSNLLYSLLFDEFIINSVSYITITFILTLLGAAFLTFLCVEYEITTKTNFLPAFFYIIFSFSAFTSNQLQPILIANLFVISGLYFLFSSYRNENTLSEFFNAGVLISIASFFYTHYIFIIPIGVIALFILKAFSLREFFCFLLGSFTPLYFYMCISYLTGSSFTKPFHLFYTIFNEVEFPIFSEYYLVLLIAIAFLLIASIFHYLSKGFGSRVKIKKIKYILIWMCILCFVISFTNITSNMFLLPCIIPFSIIFGDYVAEIKQLKIANTFLLLFISGFLIIYLHNLNII